MLACAGIGVLATASADAANYKMVLCAGNNGSNNYDTATNTISAQNPRGIFDFINACGPAPDPAGDTAWLRIAEHEPSGNAGQSAYGSISWTVPPWIAILAGGGYTRAPNAFNDGWRGRFWAEDFGGGGTHILLQGTGSANSGIEWAPTSTFAPHLWPYGNYGYFRRFVFEMTCMRPSGCDRSNYNAVDANSMVLILADVSPSEVGFTGNDSSLMQGRWVSGAHSVSWDSFDLGSGLRMERLYIDNAQREVVDHDRQCDLGWSQVNTEFARVFQPCPTYGPYDHSYRLDTASLSDGERSVVVCAEDYAQYQGLNGTAGTSCDQRTIRVDNTPPGAPAGLHVTSINPARYSNRFGATFSLPPNAGSPIEKIHYLITDDGNGGKVVVPETVVSATNPTNLPGIEGPARAGAYTLHVALEDQVGFVGPFASVPIPRDTTPPAAPQGLRIIGITARRAPNLNVRWDNITDAGSPIDTAYYQVIDSSGHVAIPAKAVSGENVEAIHGIATPPEDGDYKVRVWLSDAEGNVGASATAPVPRDTTPPAAPQDLSVAVPASSRANEGFDLRWRNVVDDGSPIDAAHYRIVSSSGEIVVPTTTVRGNNINQITVLDTPRASGGYTLLLWLSDAEGNVGAPVKAPLAYSCVRGDDAGASTLTAGLGEDAAPAVLLSQGQDTMLTGQLGTGRSHTNVPICVFSQVITDPERQFLGIALTDSNGEYRFSIPAGPSREVTAIYRPGQREVSARATLKTKVRPSFRLVRKVVRNKGVAVFEGAIPGPRNSEVVIVLQVKSGKAWRVFRRYRTREGGRFRMRYRFTQTQTPTVYIMRAQVRAQSGYPYEEGNSQARRLRVVPANSEARQAQPAPR